MTYFSKRVLLYSNREEGDNHWLSEWEAIAEVSIEISKENWEKMKTMHDVAEPIPFRETKSSADVTSLVVVKSFDYNHPSSGWIKMPIDDQHILVEMVFSEDKYSKDENIFIKIAEYKNSWQYFYENHGTDLSCKEIDNTFKE